jgi:hypothetical protein
VLGWPLPLNRIQHGLGPTSTMIRMGGLIVLMERNGTTDIATHLGKMSKVETL